jgi:hypothetical protein
MNDYCKCSYPTADSVTAKSGTCAECGKVVQIYGTDPCYNAVTMSKYTPGNRYVFPIKYPESFSSISNYRVIVIDGPDNRIVVGEFENKADANLDAAAPKLLEACKSLPLDCEFEDAADFKDNASAFLRAMKLAREAIAIAEPKV